IKLRGFRIELGEIESVLRAQPEVGDVIAVVWPQANDPRLVAYLVPAAGRELDAAALRRALQEKLPLYMVPSVFVSLAALPRTLNGKVDRKALPQPDAAGLGNVGADFVAPNSATEETLARIWCELLG